MTLLSKQLSLSGAAHHLDMATASPTAPGRAHGAGKTPHPRPMITYVPRSLSHCYRNLKSARGHVRCHSEGYQNSQTFGNQSAGEAAASHLQTSLSNILFNFLHSIYHNLQLSYCLLVNVLIWNTFCLPLFRISPMRKESHLFLFTTILRVVQTVTCI